jgi:nucleoside-diphosphate-sugar epimerase
MFTLVTGASGHVGNNLVRILLAEGRNVRVLIHKNSANLDKLDVEKVHGDVRDAYSLNAAVKGADTVYHLAALVSIETTGWDELHSINTLGTRNIARACLNNGAAV